MNEKELLSKIGLGDKESEVYLILLKRGPLSAYSLAQNTGIYRPHVYDRLQTLAVKGLVSYTKKGKTKVYFAAHPSKILDYLGERENEVKNDIKILTENMQNLIGLSNIQTEDTKVEVLTGIEGLKFCQNEIWKGAEKEVLIFGLDDKKYMENLPTFMPQYFKNLKEHGIRERVITQKKKNVFMYNNDVTTYRFMDSKDINPTNTIIYGEWIALVIWGMPITIIKIENKGLALTYREYFEKLWRIADAENIEK